jgi:hypothetical protein
MIINFILCFIWVYLLILIQKCWSCFNHTLLNDFNFWCDHKWTFLSTLLLVIKLGQFTRGEKALNFLCHHITCGHWDLNKMWLFAWVWSRKDNSRSVWCALIAILFCVTEGRKFGLFVYSISIISALTVPTCVFYLVLMKGKKSGKYSPILNLSLSSSSSPEVEWCCFIVAE